MREGGSLRRKTIPFFPIYKEYCGEKTWKGFTLASSKFDCFNIYIVKVRRLFTFYNVFHYFFAKNRGEKNNYHSRYNYLKRSFLHVKLVKQWEGNVFNSEMGR